MSKPSAPGGIPTLAARAVRPGSSASPATRPTVATFAIALIASNTAFGPSRLRAPEMGFMRRKSGFSEWAVGLKPTCATPPSTPASMQVPATGATVRAIVESAECSSPLSPAALVAWAGWAISLSISRNVEAAESTIRRPIKLSASRPAIKTTEPPRSGLRATWPFSRARLRCLGVAFSVRSSRAISSHVQCAERGPDAHRHLFRYPVGHERQRRSHYEQRYGYLHGEADREDV